MYNPQKHSCYQFRDGVQACFEPLKGSSSVLLKRNDMGEGRTWCENVVFAKI